MLHGANERQTMILAFQQTIIYKTINFLLRPKNLLNYFRVNNFTCFKKYFLIKKLIFHEIRLVEG